MISRGITVCYTGGGPSVSSTAEMALGLMLAAARRIPACDVAVRDGQFQVGTEAGILLDGKTIGLIGLGRIGARMAQYCRALGMNVVAWSQNLTAEIAAAAGAMRVTKDELLSIGGRREPASGPFRSHAWNPGRRGPRPNEAGSNPRQHLARAADR